MFPKQIKIIMRSTTRSRWFTQPMNSFQLNLTVSNRQTNNSQQQRLQAHEENLFLLFFTLFCTFSVLRLPLENKEILFSFHSSCTSTDEKKLGTFTSSRQLHCSRRRSQSRIDRLDTAMLLHQHTHASFASLSPVVLIERCSIDVLERLRTVAGLIDDEFLHLFLYLIQSRRRRHCRCFCSSASGWHPIRVQCSTHSSEVIMSNPQDID
jgi:hypothetical protein